MHTHTHTHTHNHTHTHHTHTGTHPHKHANWILNGITSMVWAVITLCYLFFRQADDWSYSPHNAYAVSKLAVLLYTYALSRQLTEDQSNITVNAVHPGVVNTSLYQHVHWSIAWAVHTLRHMLFMVSRWKRECVFACVCVCVCVHLCV